MSSAMTMICDTRRHLICFDAQRLPNLFTDVLVIGSGVAGLRAAIEAARHGSVLLIAKERVEHSNTYYAQGGIAAVLSPEDSFDQHIEDTLQVGCGLCDRPAVERIVREGPDRINELIDWGVLFDKRGEELLMGLEGGHSAPRIIHALGDETGREISDTLAHVARSTDRLRIFEDCFAIDLITVEGRCLGAITHHRHFGYQIFWARQTILATGGCGRVYRETTNPEVATGDGHALAYRAGAPLRDMEMVQFHPTTLYMAGATRALISEAVRGEGAYLVDRTGRRVMLEYHPDAELAPRDVVSQAILKEMAKQNTTCMYLDVRHLKPEKFRKRFPMISRLCEEFDIDIAAQTIPVRPAAHYMIGGVVTDADARTEIAGLLACGEVASTGVHGANRLASNSLLEGLVFGATAGRVAGEACAANHSMLEHSMVTSEINPSPRTMLDLTDIRNSLRSLMWRNVGIERNGARLAETNEIISLWDRYVMDKIFDDRTGWEMQNLLTLGRLVTAAAEAREESRGVHFRSDYPDTDQARDGQHLILQRTDDALKISTA